MISKKMKDLLNKQINMEYFSAYLYLDMANYYEEEGLSGFAHWYTLQAEEEIDHGMRIRQFCIDNDIPVTFDAIAKPNITYSSHNEPLLEALKHEKEITAAIHSMYDVATEERDYLTMQLLNWFVEEQMEEEVNANDNVRNYELFVTCGGGLHRMNSSMGKREAD